MLWTNKSVCFDESVALSLEAKSERVEKFMSASITVNEIDWSPILKQLQRVDEQDLPKYPGDLKTALLHHAHLIGHPKAEIAYQLASDIARLTTHCDPEIIYWFSRLLSLVEV